MKEKIYATLDKLKTPVQHIARYNLFIYSMMFNRYVEPSFDYADKFFTILSHKFNDFVNNDVDLLLLEASPRTGKTDFVINILLTNILGNRSKHNILIVCGNKTLKRKVRRKIERVVRTKDFFQLIFPGVNIITANESEIILSNDNVIVLTTSKSEPPTGEGFHYHFYLDYLSTAAMTSEAKREDAFVRLPEFLSRTQHNPKTKVVIDNQRLGTKDVSSVVIEQYNEQNLPVDRITFPYQFQEDTSFLVENNEIKFKKGEYLVSRFNDIEKKKILARQGAFIYETQYLQKPRKARGDLVTRDMLRYYTNEDLKTIKFVKGFITSDLALEDKKYNDYNVFIFWLVDEEDNLYLVDMVRVKMKGLRAEIALYNFYLKWKDGLGNGGVGCTSIHFENTTNSKMTIQRYEEGLIIEKIIDGKKVFEKVILAGLIKKLSRPSNKFSRFINALPHIQASKLYLPSPDVKIKGVENVNDEILEPTISELENFREDNTHDHDDIVDNIIDGINEARSYNLDLEVGF
jgi:phage terminase large subunit-like protein